MMWAKREHLLSSNLPYAERLGGIVFDSPGAVQFLLALSSNLAQQHAEDQNLINNLNVHNFCPMPTPVSTYGTHTGKIWHLPSQDKLNTFPLIGGFVSSLLAHKFDTIYNGFDKTNGAPLIFRQMVDWPEASYSAESIVKAAKSGVKSAFASYAGWASGAIDFKTAANWFKEVAEVKNQGQFAVYLERAAAEGCFPKDGSFDKQVEAGLASHYKFVDDESVSKFRLHLRFFDPDVARAMKYIHSKRGETAEAVKALYGERGSVFGSYEVDEHGVVIVTGGFANIFGFQMALYRIVLDYGLIDISEESSAGGRKFFTSMVSGTNNVVVTGYSENLQQRALELSATMPKALADAAESGNIRDFKYSAKVGTVKITGIGNIVISGSMSMEATIKLVADQRAASAANAKISGDDKA